MGGTARKGVCGRRRGEGGDYSQEIEIARRKKDEDPYRGISSPFRWNALIRETARGSFFQTLPVNRAGGLTYGVHTGQRLLGPRAWRAQRKCLGQAQGWGHARFSSRCPHD